MLEILHLSSPLFKIVIYRNIETDLDFASQLTLTRLENSIIKRYIFSLTETLNRLYAETKIKRSGIPRIFIAIDTINNLIMNWKIWKRRLENAKLFIGELKQKLASSPLFITDKLPSL